MDFLELGKTIGQNIPRSFVFRSKNYFTIKIIYHSYVSLYLQACHIFLVFQVSFTFYKYIHIREKINFKNVPK